MQNMLQNRTHQKLTFKSLKHPVIIQSLINNNNNNSFMIWIFAKKHWSQKKCLQKYLHFLFVFSLLHLFSLVSTRPF